MGDLINGRTPEEIKTAVINCDEHCSCVDCPEDERGYCDQSVIIKYARRLIEHIESERDAAMAKVPKWTSVKDGLPKPFVSVQVYMPGEAPLPTVREGFLTDKGVWHAGLYDREPGEVTHWTEMERPPEVQG